VPLRLNLHTLHCADLLWISSVTEASKPLDLTLSRTAGQAERSGMKLYALRWPDSAPTKHHRPRQHSLHRYDACCGQNTRLLGSPTQQAHGPDILVMVSYESNLNRKTLDALQWH